MTEGRRTFLARFGLGAGLLAGGLLLAGRTHADEDPCTTEDEPEPPQPNGVPSLTPVEQPKPKPPSGG